MDQKWITKIQKIEQNISKLKDTLNIYNKVVDENYRQLDNIANYIK